MLLPCERRTLPDRDAASSEAFLADSRPLTSLDRGEGR
jgi:hypothetical protein